MRLELQKLKNEEITNTAVDGDSASYIGSVSQMGVTKYKHSRSLRKESRSEIDQIIVDDYSSLRCQIWKLLPPWSHLDKQIEIRHAKSIDDDTAVSRQDSIPLERKVYQPPETPKSKDLLLQEDNITQNLVKLNANIFKSRLNF